MNPFTQLIISNGGFWSAWGVILSDQYDGSVIDQQAQFTNITLPAAAPGAWVFSTGSMKAIKVLANGEIHLRGGKVTGITVSGGTLSSEIQGSTASGVTLTNGTLNVMAGEVSAVEMYSGSTVTATEHGVVSGLTVHGGNIILSSGARVSDVTFAETFDSNVQIAVGAGALMDAVGASVNRPAEMMSNVQIDVDGVLSGYIDFGENSPIESTGITLNVNPSGIIENSTIGRSYVNVYGSIRKCTVSGVSDMTYGNLSVSKYYDSGVLPSCENLTIGRYAYATISSASIRGLRVERYPYSVILRQCNIKGAEFYGSATADNCVASGVIASGERTNVSFSGGSVTDFRVTDYAEGYAEFADEVEVDDHGVYNLSGWSVSNPNSTSKAVVSDYGTVIVRDGGYLIDVDLRPGTTTITSTVTPGTTTVRPDGSIRVEGKAYPLPTEMFDMPSGESTVADTGTSTDGCFNGKFYQRVESGLHPIGEAYVKCEGAGNLIATGSDIGGSGGTSRIGTVRVRSGASAVIGRGVIVDRIVQYRGGVVVLKEGASVGLWQRANGYTYRYQASGVLVEQYDVFDEDFDNPDDFDGARPVITVSSPVQINVTPDTEIRKVLSASVSDGGTPVFTLLEGPEWLTCSPDGVLTGVSAVEDTFSAKIRVTSGTANPSTIAVNIVVSTTAVGGSCDHIVGDPSIGPRVRFYDYDGTLLKTHYVPVGSSAEAPEIPEHKRLVFQEWNNDFDNIQRDKDVGAIYTTRSGATEIDICLSVNDGLTLQLRNITFNASANIEWGDGSTEAITTTGVVTLSHTYPDYGEYTIKVFCSNWKSVLDAAGSSAAILGGGTSSVRIVQKMFFAPGLMSQVQPSLMEALTEVTGFSEIIYPLQFQNCYSLKCYVQSKANKGFYAWGAGMKRMIFNDVVTTLQGNCLRDTKCEFGYIPDSVTTIQGQAFRGAVCDAVDSELYIPAGVTIIDSYCFYSCVRIKTAKITSPNLTEIRGNGFGNCQSLTDVYLYAVTPPTLDATAFNNTSLVCIHVPAGTAAAYKAATNWSALADIIRDGTEGESGGDDTGGDSGGDTSGDWHYLTVSGFDANTDGVYALTSGDGSSGDFFSCQWAKQGGGMHLSMVAAVEWVFSTGAGGTGTIAWSAIFVGNDVGIDGPWASNWGDGKSVKLGK